jgi:hypothetical protein
VHVEYWYVLKPTFLDPVLNDLKLGHLLLAVMLPISVPVQIVLSPRPVLTQVPPLPAAIELPHL